MDKRHGCVVSSKFGDAIASAVWLCCAMLALACSPADDFCRPELQCVDCADAGTPSDDSCISFEEAAQLAEQPRSGLRKLTATASSAGVVTVVSTNDDAICNGTTCYLRRDGEVTLYAAPQPGALFEGWSGCSASTEQRLVVSALRADTECKANFAPRYIVVNTGVTGWYYANVEIVECPGAQACAVEYGGTITLRAPTSESYHFLGWSGCSTSTDPTLVLSDVRDILPPCIARFEAITRKVSWAVADDAPGGSIYASSGPDFICGPSQCAVVLHQSIGLTATPDEGATFAGWTGCSTSTGATLRLENVTEDHHCVARFTR